MNLPEELLIYIFQLAGKESSVFIALSCKKFYDIMVSYSELVLKTRLFDIIHNPSQKEWALDIIDKTLSPTSLYRLYKFRPDYGNLVFKWNNDCKLVLRWNESDFKKTKEDNVLNSYIALYVLSGKLYCNEETCWESATRACLTCFSHYCRKHYHLSYFKKAKKSDDGDRGILVKHLCCNSFTSDRWQSYYSNYENFYENHIYYYHNMYPSKKVHPSNKKFHQSYQKLYPHGRLQQDMDTYYEFRSIG